MSHVLMRLYPIDKLLVCLQSERRRHVTIYDKLNEHISKYLLPNASEFY